MQEATARYLAVTGGVAAGYFAVTFVVTARYLAVIGCDRPRVVRNI